jgi:hypothetical protein
MQEEIESLSLESQPEVQNYLSSFFVLRDHDEDRLKDLARKLLAQKFLKEKIQGIEISYLIKGRIFQYSFLPNPKRTIYCTLSHQKLCRRKKHNLQILVDAIAECETLAKLGYSSH